jgi:uncharacterized UBP type Zn finger protein
MVLQKISKNEMILFCNTCNRAIRDKIGMIMNTITVGDGIVMQQGARNDKGNRTLDVSQHTH